MQHYNFALIFVGFQRCCVYLSILKELSANYSVAILPQEIDKKTSSRIKNTNSSFLELCGNLGADVIYSQKISADIEILPQTHYSQELINHINNQLMLLELNTSAIQIMVNSHPGTQAVRVCVPIDCVPTVLPSIFLGPL